MADIGKRIREKREALGMTQEELAAKLGYKNKSSIAKIETGTNDIVQSKVVEFATVLNTTVAYLMGWDNEKSEKKEITLTPKDEHDIKKDLDSIMEKLTNQEYGPAAYGGEELSPEAAELFREELEIALKRLKIINKEKYNPYKNKK